MLTNLKNNFVIRSVAQTEVEILTNIHEKCFPHYWNRQVFTDFFAIDGTVALVLEEDNQSIAMIVYRIVFEQADVLTLSVLPAWRRQGIAKILVKEMLDNCQKSGVRKLFLEVELGNDVAIRLYENAGFKYISRRKLYYQQLDGSLTDALVMSKKLE